MPKPKLKLKKNQSTKVSTINLDVINPHSAGIDVGADEVYVSITTTANENVVKCFGTSTPDLREMADWLKENNIITVAMESTGVYWMPVYSILTEKKIDTSLVDARRVRNVPGRKTDVSDCQWLHQLHVYGLLDKAVILPEENRNLRALLRLREGHVRTMGQAIQRMQKAMTQMNIRFDRVITDITGKTGLMVIRSIIAGEHNPQQLAKYRHGNCKHTEEDFVKALTGTYNGELIFSLKQNLELFEFLKKQIEVCADEIEKCLSKLWAEDRKKETHQRNIDPPETILTPASVEVDSEEILKRTLKDLYKIDITKFPGIGVQTALTLVAEIGTDLKRWKTGSQFASWLALCPQNKISGGKILSSKTKTSSNRAAAALRMAVCGLYRSDNYLGAHLARMKIRKGKAQAITATAHKLAIILWTCVTKQIEYNELGSQAYQAKQKAIK